MSPLPKSLALAFVINRHTDTFMRYPKTGNGTVFCNNFHKVARYKLYSIGACRNPKRNTLP